jgi:hypothetical protein
MWWAHLINAQRRHRPFLAVLGAVLLAHVLLLGHWTGRVDAGRVTTGRMQVVTLAPPVAQRPQPAPMPPAAPPLPAAAPAPAVATSPDAPARLAETPPAAMAAPPGRAASAPLADEAELPDERPVQPPPLYATQVPPPVQLRYALRYNGRPGQATLTWQHDGQRYQLALLGQGMQQALVEQLSQGGFDAAGLAPERFTDRRRGRGWQAANFQREAGLISFSGPQLTYPAWPGAQDRLSWLAQWVAIQAAAPSALPAVSLFVVDARGHGGLWHFASQGEVMLEAPGGPLAAQLWRRDPPRPEGLRVELWQVPALGPWPARLRFTAVRSGDVFELQRLPGAQPAP